MDTMEYYIDMRSIEGTNGQLIRLTGFISGELNEKSLSFLQHMSEHQTLLLDKIIAKCEQLKLQLKADDIHRIVDALYQQPILPQDMFSSIQYYLLDKRVSPLIQ